MKKAGVWASKRAGSEGAAGAAGGDPGASSGDGEYEALVAAVAERIAESSRGGDSARAEGEVRITGTQQPFVFSFEPQHRQVQLRTGTVTPSARREVLQQLREHSDFGDLVRGVDRKKHPTEAYFLRLTARPRPRRTPSPPLTPRPQATNLAKNPFYTPEEKRHIVSTIRDKMAAANTD